uniref:peptidylprolyl isomerase n=1 Tax=Locusta migratoria manilensis TaxID=229990 RepID=A0A977IVN7_LOCMI|nr:FK506 binding protein [Locusta migratoria manilensis]
MASPMADEDKSSLATASASIVEQPKDETAKEDVMPPPASSSNDKENVLEEIDLLGNGKVIKSILRRGTGETAPIGNEVTVHYRGTLLDGTEFDSSYSRKDPFTFTLGAGHVIKGWDVGVASMCKGEIAELLIQPDFAYGERGSPGSIPPNAVLKFKVELLKFAPKKKDKTMMSSEERLEAASASKEEGNKAFKSGDIEGASRMYAEAKDMLEGSEEWADAHAAAAKPLKLSVHLNLASCFLKSEAWLECVLECTAALKLDNGSVKALFRRGVARTHLAEYDTAKVDLIAAAKADPRNVEIRKALDECKKAAAEYERVSSQTYAKMFAK